MKKNKKLTSFCKKALACFLCVVMLITAVPLFSGSFGTFKASAANELVKDHYLFAYFTGTSKDGQTIHLAVSEDGLQYTSLRNNEPVIIPSKGVGCVRDPYIWYNERDNYYYILATDLDFTDGGGTYSENSESYIVWRSKDLIHWYDETFIDVNAMTNLIGDTDNMGSVWAPQVIWDGEAYMVYFSMKCNATADPDIEGDGGWNNLAIVYLRTHDLLDPNAYFEYGEIYDPSPARHVIDADIIQNPADGKYYMFYKSESANDAGLQTIYYLTADNAYGPYSSPVADDSFGYKLYPDVNVNLEGCNSYFDNEGKLITYTDEYEYTNAAGEAEAHFHVSYTTDFQNFTFYDDSVHNINSLSPRHGSVVKITESEYNRLLTNSYSISASSYSMDENLTDHLVAKYFTTADATYNAVEGKAGLSNVAGITMQQDANGDYYANFAAGSAQVNLGQLFTNGVNFQDGFTITFTATVPTDAANHTRIYEIYNGAAGSRTGVEYYSHFSASGDWNGMYVGNYNGPANVAEGKDVNTHDWLAHMNGTKANDGVAHEYIISSANGNIIVYVDGELAIMRNRFNGVTLDEAWYNAIGTATMLVGRSGWYSAGDADFTGQIQNLCIYDSSMSYYDVQAIQDEEAAEDGYTNPATPYTGTTSVIPSFANSSTSQMSSLAGTQFSNLLYSPQVTGTPSGASSSSNPTNGSAAASGSVDNAPHFGVFYANNTVLMVDGVNPAMMPAFVAGRINTNGKSAAIYNAYPTVSASNTADNPDIYVTKEWVGWNSSDVYHDTILNPDGTDHWVGHNSSTLLKNAWLQTGSSQSRRKIQYYASSLAVNEDNITFGESGYNKYNLSWQFNMSASGSDTNRTVSSSYNTFVVDFRPIVALRNEIAAQYDSIVNNADNCPQTLANYVRVCETIANLNPQAYSFSADTEAAVAELGADIQSAVREYNTVKSTIKTCEELSVTFEGREPTCILTGLTEGQYCTSCSKVIKEQTVIAEIDHNYVAAVTAPTCTTTGYTTYTCDAGCNDSYIDDETEMVAHTASTAVVENEVGATCTAGGSYDSVVYCSVCNEEMSRTPVTTDVAAHNYVAVVTAPTCTENGYTTNTCSACGDSYTSDVTEAIGHAYDDGVVTTEPGCLTEGVKTFTCANCNDTYTESVAPVGHIEDEIPAVAPTCLANGSTAGIKCIVCDEVLTDPEVVDALGHEMNEGVITTNPTCTAEGIKTYSCSRCEYTETEPVEMVAHTLADAVVENEVAATCTANGSYESVVYCSVCNMEMSRETVTTDMIAHTAGDVVVENNVDATCTAGGSYDNVVYCTVCNTEMSRNTVNTEVAAHDYVAVVTAPTCTEAGYTTYTCSVCQASYTANETSATGHTIVVDEAVAPTCTATGLTAGEHCSVCDYAVAQEEVPATGHTIVVDEAVAPTCTATGLTAGEHCSVCDYAVAQEEVPALGHTIVVDEAVAPTCTATGLTAGERCSVCDYVVAQEEVPATGHVNTTTTTVAPTYTADGKTTVTCDACGVVVSETVIPALTLVKHAGGQILFNKNSDGSYAGSFNVRAVAHIKAADFIATFGSDAAKLVDIGFVFAAGSNVANPDMADVKALVENGVAVDGYTMKPVKQISPSLVPGSYSFTCLVTNIPDDAKTNSLVVVGYAAWDTDADGVADAYAYYDDAKTVSFETLYNMYYPW